MNIEETYKTHEQQSQGRSFAFLAERCPHDDEHPFGIKTAEPLNPKQTTVLALGGTVADDDSKFRSYNWFIKKVTNFVKQHPDLAKKDIRVVGAIRGNGEYFIPDNARELFLKECTKPKQAEAQKAKMPKAFLKEYTNPSYVEDIFNTAVLSRISTNDGQTRLPTNEAMCNIRNLNIVAYCDGAFTALKLEDMMQKKMHELGYSETEKKDIQKELLILGYSPDCPLNVSKSRFICISSASDTSSKHGNSFKDYLQRNFFVRDIGLCYLPPSKGEAFYCAQHNKIGVEGSKRVIQLIPIGEWQEYQKQRTSQKPTIGEHTFLGFTPSDDMSKSAKKMMGFSNNILKNSLLHASSQPTNGYSKLPSTAKLAADNFKQRSTFMKAHLNGSLIWQKMKLYGEEKIARTSIGANIQHVRMD